MKGKKRKLRSFAGRLTRRIVLVLLIIMGLTAVWIFGLGGAFADEEEIYRYEDNLQITAENISKVGSDVYVAVCNQVPEIEESLDRPERMMKLVERTISHNPRIHSCGISFVEGYYPGKGRAYMPYAFRKDSTSIEVVNFGATNDYLKDEWFQEVLRTNEGFWTEPFFAKNDSLTPLIAYVHPIHNKQGRTVAVIGADISLNWLREKMRKNDDDMFDNQWVGQSVKRKGKKDKWASYTMLVSQKGTFLVHPDEKRIARDSIGSYAKVVEDDSTMFVVVQRIKEGKSSSDFDYTDEHNYQSVDFDGSEGYLFFTSVKHMGWMLLKFVPGRTIDFIVYLIGGIMAFFVLLAVLLTWLVGWFTIKRATKPLKQLASSADEVAKGNFNAALPEIKHNDEIRLLRDSFEGMEKSLQQYINELTTTTASKAAIENELKVAHNIQMAMLPKTFPPYPERDDIDVYGVLTPAKDVGGDLFDFYIRENLLFFCIGDVSGKGVPASLVMAVTRSLFRNVSAHTSLPDHIVTALNEALSEGNDTNMFVTLFVGVLDLATGNLSYCNAGHGSPLLIGNEVSLLPCDANLALGIMPGMTFSKQETKLDPCTTIFLYTDGLNEAEDFLHSQFGLERIMKLAATLQAQGDNTPTTIVKRMDEAVSIFVGGAEQSDDLTMLAIKYTNTHEGKDQ